MIRGFGQSLGAGGPTASDLPEQWKYVVYGGLALVIACVGLWVLARYLSATRGEPAAHESRARMLLQRLETEHGLRITTRWRPCPDGTMRWEVEAIDERSGRRWVRIDRRLMAAAEGLQQELETVASES